MPARRIRPVLIWLCSTFVCPTELIAFNDRLKEFHDLNTTVYGVSVDSEYSHLAWMKLPRKEGGLAPFQMPLIADLNKQMSRTFGVLHDETVALRGLFIMDPEGVVRSATINDLQIGRSVDETLRLVKAIQFTDKHGEVCPANWTPGAKTVHTTLPILSPLALNTALLWARSRLIPGTLWTTLAPCNGAGAIIIILVGKSNVVWRREINITLWLRQNKRRSGRVPEINNCRTVAWRPLACHWAAPWTH